MLDASRVARDEFGIDEPLGDAVTVVRHILSDRLGIALGDETTLDRLDDAARALVLARGPEGSADVITVLASQVATLTAILAGSDGDPEEVFATLICSHVDRVRRQRKAEQRLPTTETWRLRLAWAPALRHPARDMTGASHVWARSNPAPALYSQ